MALRIKEYKKNYIPNLSFKKLDFWKNYCQPNRSEILIDDESAVMHIETFKRLQDVDVDYHCYSYPGKMFKSKNYGGYYKLIWFGFHKEPNKVSVNYRKIIIID